jgi:hypothetical protein
MTQTEFRVQRDPANPNDTLARDMALTTFTDPNVDCVLAWDDSAGRVVCMGDQPQYGNSDTFVIVTVLIVFICGIAIGRAVFGSVR